MVHVLLTGGCLLKCTYNTRNKKYSADCSALTYFLKGKKAWEALFDALLNPSMEISVDSSFSNGNAGSQKCISSSVPVHALSHACRVLQTQVTMDFFEDASSVVSPDQEKDVVFFDSLEKIYQDEKSAKSIREHSLELEKIPKLFVSRATDEGGARQIENSTNLPR